MKDIMRNKRPFMYVRDVNFVTVPFFDELTPIKVMRHLKIESNNSIHSELLKYCPEMNNKGYP